MVMEFNIGQMVLTMKVNGTIIELKVKEHFGMQKEIYIKVSLKMIWPMVMGNILM